MPKYEALLLSACIPVLFIGCLTVPTPEPTVTARIESVTPAGEAVYVLGTTTTTTYTQTAKGPIPSTSVSQWLMRCLEETPEAGPGGALDCKDVTIRGLDLAHRKEVAKGVQEIRGKEEEEKPKDYFD